MSSGIAQRTLWIVLGVSLLLIGGLSVAKWQSSHARHLEDFGAIPNFSLLNQNGAPVSLATLQGHIWVADMIFTHCGSLCPRLTSKMLALQSKLKDDDHVRLASVSVDPRDDTPDTLRAYAEAHHVDTSRWTFLTGSTRAVYDLVKGGFHMPIDSTGGDQQVPIVHSQRFILIDAHGHMRGYYDSEEPDAQSNVLADISALEAEAGQ